MLLSGPLPKVGLVPCPALPCGDHLPCWCVVRCVLLLGQWWWPRLGSLLHPLHCVSMWCDRSQLGCGTARHQYSNSSPVLLEAAPRAPRFCCAHLLGGGVISQETLGGAAARGSAGSNPSSRPAQKLNSRFLLSFLLWLFLRPSGCFPDQPQLCEGHAPLPWPSLAVLHLWVQSCSLSPQM